MRKSAKRWESMKKWLIVKKVWKGVLKDEKVWKSGLIVEVIGYRL